MEENIEVTPGASLPMLKYFDADVHRQGNKAEITVHMERDVVFTDWTTSHLIHPIKFKEKVHIWNNQPNYFVVELKKSGIQKKKAFRKSWLFIWLLGVFFVGLFYYFIVISPVETVPKQCNTSVQTTQQSCYNKNETKSVRAITAKDVAIVLLIPTGFIVVMTLSYGVGGAFDDPELYKLVRKFERDTSYDEIN